MDTYFEVLSCLRKHIRISRAHWDYLTTRKHPELEGRVRDVQETLIDADFVRVSQIDPDVHLYYRQTGKYYLCVVCRHLNGSGFIITSYLTAQVKKGKELWQK